MKYIVYIPEWRTEIEAKNADEAMESAEWAYDTAHSTDPDFGKIRIKLKK